MAVSGLGSYTVPVIVYAGAIVAMTVSAVLAGFSRPFVVIGALLFLVSDSLIAVARFKAGWIPAAYLIWPTYYLGQYGIAIGFLRERAGDVGVAATTPGPPLDHRLPRRVTGDRISLTFPRLLRAP